MDVRKLVPFRTGQCSAELARRFENAFGPCGLERTGFDPRKIEREMYVPRPSQVLIRELQQKLADQRAINSALMSKLEGYKRVVSRLRVSRSKTRTILGARQGEKTSEAAQRSMQVNGQGTSTNMAKALRNLRASRQATREALGAKPSERTADAAKRVVESRAPSPIATSMYAQLQEKAVKAGFNKYNTSTYIERLEAKAAKFDKVRDELERRQCWSPKCPLQQKLNEVIA